MTNQHTVHPKKKENQKLTVRFTVFIGVACKHHIFQN